jgi:hypothetical protein
MRTKQPKVLFPAGKQKRPKQDIPTEASRLKARMARMPTRAVASLEPASAGAKPKAGS